MKLQVVLSKIGARLMKIALLPFYSSYLLLVIIIKTLSSSSGSLFYKLLLEQPRLILTQEEF